ncbi:50S ribosomal protein L10 [Candidatus Wolfebacteria bacterium]|nr:50S ribosomal protein L10 [Candidatus Wolfebacteria bacterium]
MPLTKQQKSAMIDEASKKLSSSKTTIFTEFSGVTVENFKKLRGELKKVGADVKVMKKRLVNIALKDVGISFDANQTKNQLGTVYAEGDLSSVASIIHKFAKGVEKAKEGIFNVLGAYDANEKELVTMEDFNAIATLPPREILLAQIAMMLTMPIKKMMMVLNEMGKKGPVEAPKTEEAPKEESKAEEVKPTEAGKEEKPESVEGAEKPADSPADKEGDGKSA